MRKDNRKKKNAVRMLTVGLVMGMTTPAFAAGWQAGAGANAGKWWYSTNDANTAWHANGWQWLDGNHDGVSECYYFGSDGYMYADTKTPDSYTVNKDGAWTVNGVVQTKVSEDYGKNGSWKQGAGANSGKYWFDNGDGSYRKSGWHWLDGNKDGVAECYYFDNDGWLVTGKTVENYTVDADGAWTINGVKQTKNSGLSNGKLSVTYSTSGGGSSRSSGGGGGSSSGGSGHSSNTTTNTSGSVTDSNWENYSDNSISHAANDFTNGNLGQMTASEWSETKAAIEEFKEKYITKDMSDFEKEIKIIEWLVENCEYEKAEDWSRATAYSCIIENKAQCAGYADAFLQTAKLCGLNARYICSSSHAWNLIQLDGAWYHVDVTWEDPDMPGGNNGYGFDKLRNKYINLTDAEIRTFYCHKSWAPNKIKANGSSYGYFAVKRYLDENIVDANAAAYYDEKLETILSGYETTGKIRIEYTNINDVVNKIVEYLSARVEANGIAYNYAIDFNGKYSTRPTKANYDEVKNILSSIENAVNAKLSSKFTETLTKTPTCKLVCALGANEEYYAYCGGTFSYKDGKGKQVSCNVIYKDETGKIVGTWSGSGNAGTSVNITYPNGYSLERDENGKANSVVYECTKGSVKGVYTGTSKTVILGNEDADIIVNVMHDKVFYTFNYIDEYGTTVATENGMTTIRDGAKMTVPENYALVLGDNRCPVFSVSEGDAAKVSIYSSDVEFMKKADYVINIQVKKNNVTTSSNAKKR